MKIVNVTTETLRHRWGDTTRDSVILKIESDNGLIGISRGGDPDIISKIFTPILVGEDPRNIMKLWYLMYAEIWKYRKIKLNELIGSWKDVIQLSLSLGAIDIALWDMYGKYIEEPTWRILGGFSDEVKVYADGIGYYDQTVDEVVKTFKSHSDQGYEYIKYHITEPNVDEAVDKLLLSDQLINVKNKNGSTKFMLDAFSMWSIDQAKEYIDKTLHAPIYFLEEIVKKDNEYGNYIKLKQYTNTKIAGGESTVNIFQAKQLLDTQSIDILQTDILGGGGFTGLKSISELAKSYGAILMPHGAQYPELNSHLVASISNGDMIPACPESEPYQIWSMLYDVKPNIINGVMKLNTNPGLGLDFNNEFINSNKI